MEEGAAIPQRRLASILRWIREPPPLAPGRLTKFQPCSLVEGVREFAMAATEAPAAAVEPATFHSNLKCWSDDGLHWLIKRSKDYELC